MQRGFKGFDTLLQEVEERLAEGEWISAFGKETLEGIGKYRMDKGGSGRTAVQTIIFQDDKCTTPRPVEEIAITSTGHVAVITDCIPLHSRALTKLIYPAGQVVEVYPSISSLYFDTTVVEPLLKLIFTTFSTGRGTFSSLSAGDAHFSFLVYHQSNPSSSGDNPLEEELYYNSIWSIRTDKRSPNDEAWSLLENDIDTNDLHPYIHIEGTDVEYTNLREDYTPQYARADTESENDGKELPEWKYYETNRIASIGLERMQLLASVADFGDWGWEFGKCCCGGWITVGLSVTETSQPEEPKNLVSGVRKAKYGVGKGYVFPFGKAMSAIPNLEIGEIPLENVVDISCGTEHIMVVLENGQVWSCGNNGFGQRGFQQEEVKEEGWKQVQGIREVKKIMCGKWNTFFLVERSVDSE